MRGTERAPGAIRAAGSLRRRLALADEHGTSSSDAAPGGRRLRDRSIAAEGPCHRSRPAPARTGSRCRTSRGARTIAAGTTSQSSTPLSAEPAGRQPGRAQRAVRGQEVGAPDHPRPAVRSRQDVVEALGPLEVDDQHDRGQRDEHDRQDRRRRSSPAARRSRATRAARRRSIAPVEIALKSR